MVNKGTEQPKDEPACGPAELYAHLPAVEKEIKIGTWDLAIVSFFAVGIPTPNGTVRLPPTQQYVAIEKKSLPPFLLKTLGQDA